MGGKEILISCADLVACGEIRSCRPDFAKIRFGATDEGVIPAYEIEATTRNQILSVGSRLGAFPVLAMSLEAALADVESAWMVGPQGFEP